MLDRQRHVQRVNKLLSHLTASSSNEVALNNTSNTEFDVYSQNNRTFTNWAQIASCKPEYYHEPKTISEIVDIISFATSKEQKIRVLGSGHSPANIAFTNDHLISLIHFNKIIEINKEKNTVKCQGGCKLRDLNAALEKEGLGLKNLGSISDQTIAGAISTGTHGTGIGYGILATEVSRIKFINGLGNVIECSEEDEDVSVFKAAQCSLGLLGIIVEVTIKVDPIRHLDALEYSMTTSEVESNLDKIIHGAEHTRYWWFPHTDKCMVWQANKTEPDRRNITSRQLSHKIRARRDKIVGYYSFEMMLYAATFVPQMIPLINKFYRRILFNGSRHNEDVTYKVFNFDCLFKQYVNEWSIPIEKTKEAMTKLRELIANQKFKVHYPIEVRFVKGDDIWLSPSYGGDTCWIGIIMYRPYGKDVPYQQYFYEFEKMMESLGGRPHWAKEHHWTPIQCRKSYPKFDDFCKLRQTMDPHKLFSNDYTNRVFG